MEVPSTTVERLSTSDRRERTYRLHIPVGFDNTLTPVVLDFHGFTSSANDQVSISGFETLADTEGFIVVSPFGSVAPLAGQTYWNTTTDDDVGTVDDVAFVDELLDRLATSLCVDLDRVYATGLSNGGFFSSRLACDLADRIAAIGSVAGINFYDDCAPTRPVPVLHFHGTDDPIIPFDGGPSTLFDLVDVGSDIPTAETVNFFVPIDREVGEWAAANGCGSEPEVSAVSDEVEFREYPACSADVAFYVTDGGHTWPGSAGSVALEAILGSTTLDIDATALIWEWFSEHPLV